MKKNETTKIAIVSVFAVILIAGTALLVARMSKKNPSGSGVSGIRAKNARFKAFAKKTDLRQSNQKELAPNDGDKALMRDWVKGDLAYAKEWATQNGKQNILVEIWSETDLAAATEWALSIEKESEKNKALRAIALALAQKDPKGAAEWAKSLQDEDIKNKIIGALTEKWAENDPESAMEWSMQLPEGETQNAALTKLVDKWAERDPQAAIKWALSVPEKYPGDTKGRGDFLLMRSVNGWAKNDLPAAINWIRTVPEGYDSDYIMMGVAKTWAEADPIEARSWANSLPYDKHPYIVARANVAQGWAKKDPDAAISWAKSIQDPKARKFVLLAIPEYVEKYKEEYMALLNQKD